MTIYRRGNVWWANIRIKGKPQLRQSLSTMDREEAKQRELELRLKLYNGDYRRVNGIAAPTLHDSLLRFIDEHYRPDTAKIQHSYARSLISVIGGDTLLSSIDELTINDAVNALKRAGNGPATVNRKISLLQALMKTACYKWKVIHAVPRFPLQREPEGRIRVLEPFEEEQVYQALRELGEYDIADLVMFLVDTGARLSEALRLRTQDINLEEKSAYIWQTKSGKPRVVGLTDRVVDLVTRRKGLDRPFGHITPPRLQYIWGKVRRALVLENDKEFTIHALRHTCASRLVRAAVPLYTVQKVLGHSSIKVTERYAHLNPAAIDAARKALNARAMEVINLTQLTRRAVCQTFV